MCFTLPDVFYRFRPVVHPCFLLVGFKSLAGAVAFLRLYVTLVCVHRRRDVVRLFPAPASCQRALPPLLHVHSSSSSRETDVDYVNHLEKGTEGKEERMQSECKLVSHLRNGYPRDDYKDARDISLSV